MGWKQVNTQAIDIKKHKDIPHEGAFKGSHKITTKIGDQTVWEFVDNDGIPFGVYGFTNLNRALETLEPDARVRLTYLGTENVETKYGKKDVHQVRVEVEEREG